MIGEDIRLSKLLYEKAEEHVLLEAVTQSLSITTLRFVPSDLAQDQEERENYLNALNQELLNVLQEGGEVFLSNAIVDKTYCLRACIVNFRTSEKDIEEIIDIIVTVGMKVHRELLEIKV